MATMYGGCYRAIEVDEEVEEVVEEEEEEEEEEEDQSDDFSSRQQPKTKQRKNSDSSETEPYRLVSRNSRGEEEDEEISEDEEFTVGYGETVIKENDKEEEEEEEEEIPIKKGRNNEKKKEIKVIKTAYSTGYGDTVIKGGENEEGEEDEGFTTGYGTTVIPGDEEEDEEEEIPLKKGRNTPKNDTKAIKTDNKRKGETQATKETEKDDDESFTTGYGTTVIPGGEEEGEEENFTTGYGTTVISNEDDDSSDDDVKKPSKSTKATIKNTGKPSAKLPVASKKPEVENPTAYSTGYGTTVISDDANAPDNEDASFISGYSTGYGTTVVTPTGNESPASQIKKRNIKKPIIVNTTDGEGSVPLPAPNSQPRKPMNRIQAQKAATAAPTVGQTQGKDTIPKGKQGGEGTSGGTGTNTVGGGAAAPPTAAGGGGGGGSVRANKKLIKEPSQVSRQCHWNMEFQEALDMKEGPAKWTKLSKLAHDFVYCSKTYGKIIISEYYLPEDQKTIKSIDAGGLAGGSKYICANIFFKFALDTDLMENVRKQKGLSMKDAPPLWMYGGSENDDYAAMKGSKNDMTGLMSYYNAKIPGLYFPLMALIDYRGFRLIAMSILPITKKSIKYGSADGGITVHKDCKELNKKMKDAAELLNLKGHRTGKRRVMIFGPGDIEAHLGEDNKYYVVDFGRTFPPEAQSVPGSRKIFYCLLRPEFVRRYRIPLSSDAFSCWGKCNANIHDPEVRQATQFLYTTVIPEFAETLAKQESPNVWETVRLTELLHSSGINCRHLGRVRSALPAHCRNLHDLLATEMVARTLSALLRQLLRLEMKRTKIASQEPYKTVVIDFINALLNTTETNDTCTISSSFYPTEEVAMRENTFYNNIGLFPAALGKTSENQGGSLSFTLNESLNRSINSSMSSNYSDVELDLKDVDSCSYLRNSQFWTRDIKKWMETKFTNALRPSELSLNLKGEKVINLYYLLIRLLEQSGCKLSKHALGEFKRNPAQFKVLNFDLRSVSARVKHLNVIDEAEGNLLYSEAKTSSHRQGLWEATNQKFAKAVCSNTNNPLTFVRWGIILLEQCSKVTGFSPESQKQKLLDAAEEKFMTALKLNPKMYHAEFELANLYVERATAILLYKSQDSTSVSFWLLEKAKQYYHRSFRCDGNLLQELQMRVDTLYQQAKQQHHEFLSNQPKLITRDLTVPQSTHELLLKAFFMIHCSLAVILHPPESQVFLLAGMILLYYLSLGGSPLIGSYLYGLAGSYFESSLLTSPSASDPDFIYYHFKPQDQVSLTGVDGLLPTFNQAEINTSASSSTPSSTSSSGNSSSHSGECVLVYEKEGKQLSTSSNSISSSLSSTMTSSGSSSIDQPICNLRRSYPVVAPKDFPLFFIPVIIEDPSHNYHASYAINRLFSLINRVDVCIQTDLSAYQSVQQSNSLTNSLNLASLTATQRVSTTGENSDAWGVDPEYNNLIKLHKTCCTFVLCHSVYHLFILSQILVQVPTTPLAESSTSLAIPDKIYIFGGNSNNQYNYTKENIKNAIEGIKNPEKATIAQKRAVKLLKLVEIVTIENLQNLQEPIEIREGIHPSRFLIIDIIGPESAKEIILNSLNFRGHQYFATEVPNNETLESKTKLERNSTIVNLNSVINMKKLVKKKPPTNTNDDLAGSNTWASAKVSQSSLLTWSRIKHTSRVSIDTTGFLIQVISKQRFQARQLPNSTLPHICQATKPLYTQPPPSLVPASNNNIDHGSTNTMISSPGVPSKNSPGAPRIGSHIIQHTNKPTTLPIDQQGTSSDSLNSFLAQRSRGTNAQPLEQKQQDASLAKRASISGDRPNFVLSLSGGTSGSSQSPNSPQSGNQSAPVTSSGGESQAQPSPPSSPMAKSNDDIAPVWILWIDKNHETNEMRTLNQLAKNKNTLVDIIKISSTKQALKWLEIQTEMRNKQQWKQSGSVIGPGGIELIPFNMGLQTNTFRIVISQDCNYELENTLPSTNEDTTKPSSNTFIDLIKKSENYHLWKSIPVLIFNDKSSNKEHSTLRQDNINFIFLTTSSKVLVSYIAFELNIPELESIPLTRSGSHRVWNHNAGSNTASAGQSQPLSLQPGTPATRNRFLLRSGSEEKGVNASGSPYGSPMMDEESQLNQSFNYFEVSILQMDKGAVLSIGVASKDFPVEGPMLGTHSHSYGYQSDGTLWFGYPDKYCQFSNRLLSHNYGVGDTIGCGYDDQSQQIYWTKNGIFLGFAERGYSKILFQLPRLYPTVCFILGCQIRGNFGKSPFIFDIDRIKQNQSCWRGLKVEEKLSTLQNHSLELFTEPLQQHRMPLIVLSNISRYSRSLNILLRAHMNHRHDTPQKYFTNQQFIESHSNINFYVNIKYNSYSLVDLSNSVLLKDLELCYFWHFMTGNKPSSLVLYNCTKLSNFLSRLPQPEIIQTLILSECSQIHSPTAVKYISEKFTNLRNITLWPSIDGASIIQLCSIPTINKFDFTKCNNLDDKVLITAFKADRFKNTTRFPLISLNFTACENITDDGFIRLVTKSPQIFYGIQSFNFNYCKSITSASIGKLIACCKQLQHFHYAMNPQPSLVRHIGDNVLVQLATTFKDKLQTLVLVRALRVDEQSFKTIAENCPNLTCLDLAQNSEITDTALAAFAESGNKLIKLDLYNCIKLSYPTALKFVKNHPCLRYLSLSRTKLIPIQLKELLGFIKNIEILHLQQNLLSDAFIRSVADMKLESLLFIDISNLNKPLSPDSIKYLQNAYPNLSVNLDRNAGPKYDTETEKRDTDNKRTN